MENESAQESEPTPEVSSKRKATPKSTPAVGNTITVSPNPLTGTATDALPRFYHPDEVEKRNATRLEPSGVKITADEYERRVLAQIAASDNDDECEPSNHFNDTANAYRASDPDQNDYVQYDLRYINPDYIDKGLGWRDWEPVEDPKTKGQMTVARQILARMPKEKSIRRRLHRAGLGKQRIADIAAAHEERVRKDSRDAGVAATPFTSDDAQRWVYGSSDKQ